MLNHVPSREGRVRSCGFHRALTSTSRDSPRRIRGREPVETGKVAGLLCLQICLAGSTVPSDGWDSDADGVVVEKYKMQSRAMEGPSWQPNTQTTAGEKN